MQIEEYSTEVLASILHDFYWKSQPERETDGSDDSHHPQKSGLAALSFLLQAPGGVSVTC